MVRCGLKIISILLLCNLFLVISLPIAYAQDEIEEPAEIVATVDTPNNRIPPVRISEWTTINLTVEDVFGINWTYLKGIFPIQSVYIWPIIHPNWRPFLGFTSVRFEPEIIQGNPRGWYTKVTPSAIAEANQGRTYNLKLEVLTDDIAVDYAVVIGVKTTRVDVFGNDIGVSYIYIPVKASALNNIKMEADITQKDGGLHSIVYFDIDIKNFGYYRDMFKLNFTEDNGLLALSSTQLIVLNPEESQKVRINILTPEKLWDPGTPNKIAIYASSSSDPTPMHIGTIVVVTKGMYLSPLFFVIALPIIIFLVLVYLLFYLVRTKKEQKILVKPQKPWTVPEEKKYLEELKQKDKEKYESELKMMDSEYKSATLWYKSYLNSVRIKEKNGPKIGGFLGNIVKRQKKSEVPNKEIIIDNKKQKKEPNNRITKFLTISKPKNNIKKKNNYQIKKIFQSSKNKKTKKTDKKKNVIKTKDEDKTQILETQQKSEEDLKKKKLISQIKKDQNKQKRRIK